MRFEELGDRMKMFEKQPLPERFIPGLPVMARMDGRAFHTFTKGMARPFSPLMTKCMVETTRALVKASGARMGYTQSDEITLMFYEEDPKSQLWFDGKGQKLISNLASETTLEFYLNIVEELPLFAPKLPKFDARVWQVPSREEAINAFIWREMDATKNSVSMMAQTYFSHKQLQGVGTKAKIALMEEHGLSWAGMPDSFKRGTYLRREESLQAFSTEELSKLPPKHEARTNPALQILRSQVKVMEMPPILKVKNREGVFFRGEVPTLE